MKLVRNLMIAASMASLVTSVAIAAPKKKKAEPNCEVAGKKSHVKDEAACTAKKGTWLAAKPADAAPTTQPVEAKPADAAPAAAGTDAPK